MDLRHEEFKKEQSYRRNGINFHTDLKQSLIKETSQKYQRQLQETSKESIEQTKENFNFDTLLGINF